MGYFGGLGAGKGWLKLGLLVSPELLRDALQATRAVAVITNARVPARYETTPLDAYVASYARYVEAMLASAKAADDAAGRIDMSLASSRSRLSSTPCPDRRYKRMECDEPVVHLSPLCLDYDAHWGELRVGGIQSSLYFGIELTFPRLVTHSRDGHAVFHDTRDFETRRIFEDLKRTIQKATRPCRIRSPAREHRTRIRLGKDMAARMQRHPVLRRTGLRIV